MPSDGRVGCLLLRVGRGPLAVFSLSLNGNTIGLLAAPSSLRSSSQVFHKHTFKVILCTDDVYWFLMHKNILL